MEKSAFLHICAPSFFTKKPIIHDDSRLIAPGDIFVMHPGNSQFISTALAARPSFVLFYKECAEILSKENGVKICTSPEEVGQVREGQIGAILVQEGETIKDLLKLFYGPSDIATIAITGTNGKTSTTTFTRQILGGSGIRSASIEGGNIVIGDSLNMKLGLGLTTPSIYDMYKTLYISREMYGAKAIVFEASSHGIEQGRISGMNIKTAAFTNFSQDHLDYHLTMESYFNAKKRLFSDHLAANGTAVLNQDIPEFEEIKTLCLRRGVKVITYGRLGGDVQFLSGEINEKGKICRYNIAGKEFLLEVPLFGSFQEINLACSIAICLNEMGNELYKHIEMVAARLQSPKGRMQPVLNTNGETSNVYVDYAHTPDALKVVLSEIQRNKNGRLITVFGCGGDRDNSKRPIMGKIASSLSDVVFITDDNPRTEDASKIRKEIMSGIEPENRYKAIEVPTNRHDAIVQAIKERKEDDTVIILGKGSESYQIIGTERVPFSDHKTAYEAVFSMKQQKFK